jgi:hypothetical protein
LFESIQATAKYGKWVYAHLGFPRNNWLTVAVLVAGVALLFYENIRQLVNRRPTARRPKKPEISDWRAFAERFGSFDNRPIPIRAEWIKNLEQTDINGGSGEHRK